MKMRLLKPSIIIIVMLIPSIIQVVKATSVIREYDQDFYYQADKLFTFKAKIIIETELDGKWKINTYYQENITLALTYLNPSRFNAEGFRLLFHSPSLLVNELSSGHGALEIVNSSANVTVGRNGTIAWKYSPSTLDGERLQLKSHVEYIIYENNQPWSLETSWASPEPISVETEKENPPPDYTLYICISIGILITAVTIGTYLTYKLRKPKRKRRQRFQKHIINFVQIA